MPPKKRARRSWGTIRKLPSGRYQCRYVGPDLATHYAPHTFTAKVDAEGWLTDERRLIEREVWTPPAARNAAPADDAPAKPLFGPYATKVITERKLSRRTKGTYEGLLRVHIAPTFDRMAIADISPADIRAWYAKVSPTGRAERSEDDGFETTQRRAAELLRMILNTAVEDNLIEATPFKLKLTALRPKDIDVLTLAEVDKLAAALPARVAAIALIAGYCGLRRGEVFELRRKDLTADCSRITVARQVQFRGGAFVVRPKSGSAGSVIVPARIRPRLIEHLDQHVGPDPDELLFPSVPLGQTHLSEWTFRNWFFAARATIGRPTLALHDLRHVAAVAAAQAGGTAREIQERLRHSTGAAAARYQHVGAGRAELLADRISQLAEDGTA